MPPLAAQPLPPPAACCRRLLLVFGVRLPSSLPTAPPVALTAAGVRVAAAAKEEKEEKQQGHQAPAGSAANLEAVDPEILAYR